MADFRKRVSENVPGEFFVDSTCIDCDTCRQIAPATFAEAAEHAFVHAQPQSQQTRRSAFHALLSCPTGSIGFEGHSDAKAALEDFPLVIEDPVYYCGFNSPKSYGGNSYFIRHPEGNWLVDSPKFLTRLVTKLESLGGIKYVFLTHRDDVADAERFAKHFQATRIIHRDELASQPDAEWILEGDAPIQLANEWTAIPTPGHTRGHATLLFRDRFLFTGDHLYGFRDSRRVGASKSYCWHSWSKQTASMQRLLDFSFEWILPGHGQKICLPADEMRKAMSDLVSRMKESL